VRVLMPVDEIRRPAKRRLEGVELTLDLGRDLVRREASGERARDQRAVRREKAVRRKPRHRPERSAEREVEVEPDRDAAAKAREFRGHARP
jgi:hypothetical protein